MGVAKRYCYDDAVINYNKREPIFEDLVRRKIFNYIYDGSNYSDIIKKIHSYKRMGKDTYCLWEELTTLNALVDLFLIIKTEVVCSNLETFNEVLDTYKLDCIEESLRCKFGKGGLVNELIDLLALRTPLRGISYMGINNNECLIFKVH